MSVKERVVSRIAQYFKVMFGLRFDRAGSPYLSSPSGNDVSIGPIVSTPFYRALDGVVRVPGAELSLSKGLSQYRGPFSNTTDYLQSFLRAELYLISHHRSVVLAELGVDDKDAAQSQLEVVECALGKALKLCSVYPGEHQPGGPISTPAQPFSLRLDDFRLSNVMVCFVLTGYVWAHIVRDRSTQGRRKW